MDGEPFDAPTAKALILAILQSGTVTFTGHAEKEMAKDGLFRVDAVNVLRGGLITEPAEQVRGTWRYRVRTSRIVVVVAFRGKAELVVVTAWRIKR